MPKTGSIIYTLERLLHKQTTGPEKFKFCQNISQTIKPEVHKRLNFNNEYKYSLSSKLNIKDFFPGPGDTKVAILLVEKVMVLPGSLPTIRRGG